MAGFHCAMNAVAAGAGAAWVVVDEAMLAAAANGPNTLEGPSHAAVMPSISSSVAICEEQSSSGITSELSILSPADWGLCVTATQPINHRRQSVGDGGHGPPNILQAGMVPQ